MTVAVPYDTLSTKNLMLTKQCPIQSQDFLGCLGVSHHASTSSAQALTLRQTESISHAVGRRTLRIEVKLTGLGGRVATSPGIPMHMVARSFFVNWHEDRVNFIRFRLLLLFLLRAGLNIFYRQLVEKLLASHRLEYLHATLE